MAAKLALRFDEAKQRFRGGQQAGLVAIANEAKFRLIGKLYETKSGRIYGPHRASAPGEAPASDTKALEESIKAQLTSSNTASVFSDSPYAVALEYGTAHMAPRPMWAQVLEDMKDVGPEIMAREMKKALG